MTHDPSMLQQPLETHGSDQVFVGNGNGLPISQVGKSSLSTPKSTFLLNDVLYVKGVFNERVIFEGKVISARILFEACWQKQFFQILRRFPSFDQVATDILFHKEESADRRTSGVDSIRVSRLGEGSLGFEGRVDYQRKGRIRTFNK